MIGLSTAYHLASNQAARVIVIEKQSIGSGSSSRAAGITTGLLWSETGVMARRLGIEWFRRLSRELPGYAYHDEHGCLNLFTPEMWAERVPLLPLYDRLGKEYQVLTAAEIGRRWPALHPPEDFIGLHDPSGGYSEPDEYIAALVQRLRQLRVEIVEGQQVEDFLVSNGRVVGVRTSSRPLRGRRGHQRDSLVESPALAKTRLAASDQELRASAICLGAAGRTVRRTAGECRSLSGVHPPGAGRANPPGRGNCRATAVGRRSREFAMDELSTSANVRDEAVQRFEFLRARLAQRAVGVATRGADCVLDGRRAHPRTGSVACPACSSPARFTPADSVTTPWRVLLLAEMAAGKPPSVDVTAFSPDRFSADATEAYLQTTLAQSQAVRRRH